MASGRTQTLLQRFSTLPHGTFWLLLCCLHALQFGFWVTKLLVLVLFFFFVVVLFCFCHTKERERRQRTRAQPGSITASEVHVCAVLF